MLTCICKYTSPMAVDTWLKNEPFSKKKEASGIMKELSRFTERLILIKSVSGTFPFKWNTGNKGKPSVTRDTLKTEILNFLTRKNSR